MALNPLSSIDTSRAVTTFRAPLKIATRSTPDLRVRKDEAYRQDHQWRRTIETIKESMAGAIDAFVTSAAAEANAAAEDTRAQATIEKVELLSEITRQQLVIAGLQADLVAEREQLKCMRNQLAIEVAARLRSESERDLAQQHLDDALASRPTLMTASLSVEPSAVETAADVEIDDVEPVAMMSLESSIVVPAPAGDPIAVVAHPEVVADICRVLEQVKAIYDLDVESNLSPAELVDSLTIRLRQARDVVVARSGISEGETIALFDQQIDELLFSSTGTFARHLSISAYSLSERK
jgi:hypothetical protein